MRERHGKVRNVRIGSGANVIDVAVTLRDTDRLSISVHPDLQVTATAPTVRPFADVVERIRARERWIRRQRKHFMQYKPEPAPRRYVSGETYVYLGRQYRLRVCEAAVGDVKMVHGYIVVNTPDRNDRAHVRRQLDDWYGRRASEILRKRCEVCRERMRSLDVGDPQIMLRQMKKRWGSCTSSRRILLNPELIRVPVHCIDYVVTHELCHLRVPRHNPQFYRLLTRYMPDWTIRKRKLDSIVVADL